MTIYTVAFEGGRPLQTAGIPFRPNPEVTEQLTAYLEQEEERILERGEGVHTDIAPRTFQDKVDCTLTVEPDGRGTLVLCPRNSTSLTREVEATTGSSTQIQPGKRVVHLPRDNAFIPLIEQSGQSLAILWAIVFYLDSSVCVPLRGGTALATTLRERNPSRPAFQDNSDTLI